MPVVALRFLWTLQNVGTRVFDGGALRSFGRTFLGLIIRSSRKRESRCTGKKGFVILTKSFVKIGITKTFFTTTKCLVLPTKRLVAAAKFLVAATKILSVVPNFVAVTKPHFFRVLLRNDLFEYAKQKCLVLPKNYV